MGVVRLPVGRLGRAFAERKALRNGVAAPRPIRPAIRVVGAGGAAQSTCCAACAAPIEVGEVWRGTQTYCSIECALGGDRPA
jgi:hypothetical protein